MGFDSRTKYLKVIHAFQTATTNTNTPEQRSLAKEGFVVLEGMPITPHQHAKADVTIHEPFTTGFCVRGSR